MSTRNITRVILDGELNNTPSKAGGFCVNLKLAQAEARFRGLKVTLRLKPFSQT